MTFVSWLLAVVGPVFGVGPVAGVGGFDVGALVVLTATAATAATVAFLATLVILRQGNAAPDPTSDLSQAVGMRARANGVAVVPQRDPDAAGHSRPRAPGRSPTASRSIAAAA